MNKYFIMVIVFVLNFISCGTINKGMTGKIESGSNNFFISVYDSDVENPENDRRCYYMIYIDKAESGRTAIGLESQEKDFNALLTENRHLIKIEKWVLNENLGRYVKLNNIEQPKPDFIYFNIEGDKIIKIKVKSSKAGIASYSMTAE